MAKEQQVGRVTFRAEGEILTARWAPEQTSMEGAVFLASIQRAACDRDFAIFEAFKALAQLIVAKAIEETLGSKPTWSDTVAAPEHERSGSS